MPGALHGGSYGAAVQTYWVRAISGRRLPIQFDSGTLDLVVHEIQDPAAWRRLARLLVARRVQLGWGRRNAFVEAHSERLPNGRNIDAIETAERMNFSPSTLALVEILYQWKPGSIDDVLAGGDPRPIDEDVVVVHDLPPAASAERMECRFIIDRLGDDQLAEALRVLRGMERR